ncbi:MAG: DUF1700 domain-containing protein [Lachnospiraceae bacterium]|nr:DUF1700 domain-containing protein [Lachnospiraceae bacterium]
MTKQDFLEGLRRYLSGSLDYRQVNEHLRYYTEYIDSQLRQGKTEEEVMAGLGDPRLIAKTLTEMEGADTVSGEYREEYIEDEAEPNPNDHYVHFNGKTLRVPGWLFSLLLCLVVFCVLTVVFTVISWFLPYLLVIFGCVMLYRFFRRNL